jgi:hypothetical protein
MLKRFLKGRFSASKDVTRFSGGEAFSLHQSDKFDCSFSRNKDRVAVAPPAHTSFGRLAYPKLKN